MLYNKPGDVLDRDTPVLFDVAAHTETIIDNTLFPNAYNMTRIEWRHDGRAFTFEYNQRGHQIYRVIEVDAKTGKARAIIYPDGHQIPIEIRDKEIDPTDYWANRGGPHDEWSWMIFQPAGVFRITNVNRPDASPPPAAVRFRSYFPVASARPAASGRTSISEKVSVPIASRLGYRSL